MSKAPNTVRLRSYQEAALSLLRDHIRQGRRRLVVCAPTGAGKTIVAAEMLRRACAKGRTAAFLTETTALVDQTCAVLQRFGINHDVVWRERQALTDAPVRVCMIQTLASGRAGRDADREWVRRADLLILDECHICHKASDAFIAAHSGVVIGLSATPMRRNMHRRFDAIVNVRTTDALLADGHLAPLRPFHLMPMDMDGARITKSGEFHAGDAHKRAMVVVGDVVRTWRSKTRQEFGGPVPTLVYAASIAHGAALRREFAEAGFKFDHVQDGDSLAEREAKLQRFAQGRVQGLINCEVLGKGFDRPEVQCIVAARPYRQAFSKWAQQVGRGMRPHAGKTFCLLLDHAGNYPRFQAKLEAFFAVGHHDLVNAAAPQPPGDDRHICLQCGFVSASSAVACANCGMALPPLDETKDRRQGGKGKGPAVIRLAGVPMAVPPLASAVGNLWEQCCRLAQDAPLSFLSNGEWACTLYEAIEGLPTGSAAALPFTPCREPADRGLAQLAEVLAQHAATLHESGHALRAA